MTYTDGQPMPFQPQQQQPQPRPMQQPFAGNPMMAFGGMPFGPPSGMSSQMQMPQTQMPQQFPSPVGVGAMQGMGLAPPFRPPPGPMAAPSFQGMPPMPPQMQQQMPPMQQQHAEPWRGLLGMGNQQMAPRPMMQPNMGAFRGRGG